MNLRDFLLGLITIPAAAVMSQTPEPSRLGFRLVDVSAQGGIHFHHNSGAYGGKFLPETLGKFSLVCIAGSCDERAFFAGIEESKLLI